MNPHDLPRAPRLQELAATQVARYRATLGVIDEAQRRGVLLAQEDAAALVDRVVATYMAVLAGGPR